MERLAVERKAARQGDLVGYHGVKSGITFPDPGEPITRRRAAGKEAGSV